MAAYQHLNKFDSLTLMEETLGASSVEQIYSIGSNSLLLTLEATAVSGGASLTLELYQFTSDDTRLQLHGTLGPVSVVDGYSRNTFTALHNKILIKVINSAGSADFNVYGTAVESYASTNQIIDGDGDELEINPDGSINASFSQSLSSNLETKQQTVTTVESSLVFPAGFTANNFLLKNLGDASGGTDDYMIWISETTGFTPGVSGQGFPIDVGEGIPFEDFDSSSTTIYLRLEAGAADQRLAMIALD